MNSVFKGALRRLQRPGAPSYRSELFQLDWSYHSGSNEDFATPAAQTSSQNPESIEPTQALAGPTVAEKTKVLDSFHQFVNKQLGDGKEALSFPGGTVKKKSDGQTSFVRFGLDEDLLGTELDPAELLKQNCAKGDAFGNAKFSVVPKPPVKVLFVAEESVDIDKLPVDASRFEAFFEPAAALLFERMTQAMRLRPEEMFISSLKIVNQAKSLGGEQILASEILSLKPRLVVPLGGAATAAFLGKGSGLQTSHGRFYELRVQGENSEFLFEAMPLFSPAVLLEAPNSKRIAWEDMQKAMKKLGHS